MSSPYPPSPVPSDADLWPEEKPFTAFGQFGEDSFDLRVFEQDEYWVDYRGKPHRLSEMPNDYRVNVITFLEERKDRFYVETCLRTAVSMAGDALLGRVNGELLAEAVGGPKITDHTPSEWLEATPLMRRLRTLTSTNPNER